MKRMRTMFVIPMMLILAITMNACFLSSKEGIQKADLKLVTAVQTARKVTTTQHDFGKLTDEGYVRRLQAFKNVYTANNVIEQKFEAFTQITPENKEEFATAFQSLITALDELVKAGAVGVKSDASQEDFSRWLGVASLVAGSAKVAIAAIQKPVNISNVKIAKM